jgi:CDP-glucose 4,6-dehydratase
MEGLVTMDDAFWSGRRVLITGATGMVGAWLVKELLRRGAQIVALVRDHDPQTEFYRSGDSAATTIVTGQLEDFMAVERALNDHEVNTVFHLAAQPIVGAALRNPLATFETNIRGTYNLLEACRRLNGLVERVVIASSDKAYGTSVQLPYTESMPLRGEQPYEVSKSCADLIATSYHRTFGMRVAIARCGNIFGGGDLNWSRLVPGVIRAGLEARPFIIRSDGQFVRDYLYVKEAVAAYCRLAECLSQPDVAGEAFNFGPETAISVLQMVGHIQRLMQTEAIGFEIRDTARGEIRSQYLDSTKARQRLGWQSRFRLDEALSETIDWYRRFFDHTRTTLNA